MGTSDYNTVLHDGRDLSRADLIDMLSSSSLTVGERYCFYLDENFEYRRALCTEKRAYVCEYKGKARGIMSTSTYVR